MTNHVLASHVTISISSSVSVKKLLWRFITFANRKQTVYTWYKQKPKIKTFLLAATN